MKVTHFIVAMMIMLLAIGTVSAVSGLPFVDFTGTPTEGAYPLAVTFDKITTNTSAAIYTWDFGDGWTLTGAHVTHTYQNPGVYNVTLQMQGMGWGYTMSKAGYITVTHVKPVAGFTTDVDGGASDTGIQFTSTTTGYEPVLSWDFGDGYTSNLTNPHHTYFNYGNTSVVYTATLTASNDGGSDTFSKDITILPARPHADFIATSPTFGQAPLAVNFEDRSTGAGIATRSWDFGDGQVSSATNPLHAYATPGQYSVILTVISPSGTDTETKHHYITVTNESTCYNVATTSTKIGSYNYGVFALDLNGNYLWDGTPVDFSGFMSPEEGKAVIGDWNGDGKDEIGTELNGFWKLDYNGNRNWDGASIDKFVGFGQTGDNPIVGDWNNDGKDEIGSELNGFWAIDYNGNFQWDGILIDRFAGFGSTGDMPIAGKWT